MLQAVRPSTRHSVKFYANEQSLYTTVAAFLGQALTDGQSGILIATKQHRSEMLHVLRGRKIDVAGALRVGNLVVLDASETLERFMVGGAPDERAFDASVGTLIGGIVAARDNHIMIHAYGEMVNVLWQDGQTDAAIKLEMLWNKLSARFQFSLLCGYAMGHFYRETKQFESVCRRHTHVMPPDEPAGTEPTRH
jgi:hypothetical protein